MSYRIHLAACLCLCLPLVVVADEKSEPVAINQHIATTEEQVLEFAILNTTPDPQIDYKMEIVVPNALNHKMAYALPAPSSNFTASRPAAIDVISLHLGDDVGPAPEEEELYVVTDNARHFTVATEQKSPSTAAYSDGMRDSLQAVIKARFGHCPPHVVQAVKRIHDAERLSQLIATAITASSVDELGL